MLRPASWRTIVLMTSALLLTGCFLFPKKKSGGSASSATQLIDRTSIFMDRIGDGTTARVQFKTTSNAQCQMTYYSQVAGTPPTKDAPTAAACSTGPATMAFTEQVTSLRADTLYYVTVTAWDANSSAANGDTVTIAETPTNSSIVSGTDANGTTYKELMIAQFDLPLLTAEVHRNALAAPADIPAIKAQLTRVPGCQQGSPPKDGPFRDADPNIGITNLTTQDLASGTAVVHPDYPERLQLSYPSLNAGVGVWTLLYSANGADVKAPISQVAHILNIDMANTSTYNFEATQLLTAPDAVAIDATKPLTFSWTTDGTTLDLAYMTVQIGRPGYDKGIYCVFPAAALTGSVDPKYLGNLDEGTHVVTAELATNLVWAKDGWVVTTYDWRWGQIQK